MKFILLSFIAAASMLSAADFFPLSIGNQWTLRSSTGAMQEVRVGTNLLSKDDQTYYRLTGYRAEGSWMRRDEKGDLQWLNMETEAPEVIARFDGQSGDYRTQLGTCPQIARVDTKRVEWNHLPALKIQYEGGCPDNAVTEELYLENVGLVRRVVSTFIGPVTYDLVEAKVGNLIYANQPGAFFDISIPSATIKSENGEAVTKVNLRLNARNGLPVRLMFSTGQQYDFKLFNRAGELVWQWSKDRVFTQGLSDEEVVNRSWEKNILIEGVTPGIYILEGSLTNSGPWRFAAAMTVQID